MSMVNRQCSQNLNNYITTTGPTIIDIDELPLPPPLPPRPPPRQPQPQPQPQREWCCQTIDIVPTTDEPSSGCCFQEARKACCIWLVYCLCVCHIKWVLKMLLGCATLSLPILEIFILIQDNRASQTISQNIMATLFTDAVISVVLVFCAIVTEYVMYIKTFRNIMVTYQDGNNNNYHFANSVKYAIYLFVLLAKSSLTSTGLSFLTTNNTTIYRNMPQQHQTEQSLLAINIVILLTQCMAIVWCFFYFLHHRRRDD